MDLDLLASSPEEISRLRALLADGGVAAIPTETFYGLAADPRSERGVERIVRVKGRDDGKPLPVVAAEEEQLRGLGIDVPAGELVRWLEIWPAPLTVIFRIVRPVAASRGAMTLAVRIPAMPRLRRLLEATGPLTATSANRSGGFPCDDPDSVEALFGDEIDVLVDGGRTPGGKPSTIVDATGDPPRVLRAGAFEWPPSSLAAGVEPGPRLC